MNLYQQLVQERQACLEPPPAGLPFGEKPDAEAIVVDAFSSNDAGDLERLFDGASECIQLTPGRFKSDVRSVRIGSVALSECTVNCGILLRAHVDDDTVLICVPDAAEGVRVIENGRPCAPHEPIVVARRDLTLCILGAATIAWFAVDLARVPRALRPEVDVRSGREAATAAGAAAAAALRDFVRWHLLLTKGERFALSLIGESDRVDTTAIGLLIAILRGSNTLAQTNAMHARSDLVQSAEEFMWENIEGPLSLDQICAVRGCKVRTLIYAFKAQFGLSPMKYFKVRRLNAARRKLHAATARVRVFDVAADCGFWHMGHFGKDFKAMFGVTPESTRRHRALDEARSGSFGVR